MIVLELRRLGRGKWLAHNYGPQLDGGRIFKSRQEASQYNDESFRQMFPEHVCTERCQPSEDKTEPEPTP